MLAFSAAMLASCILTVDTSFLISLFIFLLFALLRSSDWKCAAPQAERSHLRQ